MDLFNASQNQIFSENLYYDQNLNLVVQNTSTQTVTWAGPSGPEEEEDEDNVQTDNSYPSQLGEFVSHQEYIDGPHFVMMTPEQHAAYLSTLYGGTVFQDGNGGYFQYQPAQIDPIQYYAKYNISPILQLAVDSPQADTEKEESTDSEEMTPIEQHELLQQAVQKFQMSNSFKVGVDESSQPFLTSDQLVALMSEFPQLVAQPSQPPPVSSQSPLRIKIPIEQQTPLQRLEALLPPLPSDLPRKSLWMVPGDTPKREPSPTPPPILSPQFTYNEFLEIPPLISPVSSMSSDSWGSSSIQQIASLSCPLQPTTSEEPETVQDSVNDSLTCIFTGLDPSIAIRRLLDETAKSPQHPYYREDSQPKPKRRIRQTVKAGRQEKVKRPEINFLDATGLEAEIGSHQDMEMSQLLQLIAEFMAKNEISRLQVAHMTDTNTFYISWFLEGKHEDIHPDCKLIFITWYLNCCRYPEKLEEYLSYPTIQPSLDMSFSKIQQEMLLDAFQKEEKVILGKLVEDINKKLPRTLKSATMTSKLVFIWYRCLTAKNRAKKKLQPFPKGAHSVFSLH